MTDIQTENLTLVLQTPEDVRARIMAMSPRDRAEMSADWLARVEAAKSPDPWVHGFALRHRASGTVVGTCGFKAPPAADGSVEIAYGVDPDHQGRGYATEAARALAACALGQDAVRIVCAHTLQEISASARVLTKCGFQCVGQVNDPEDGWVWRWEKGRSTA